MRIVKAKDLSVGDICVQNPGAKNVLRVVKISEVGETITAKKGSWKGQEMTRIVQLSYVKDSAGCGYERGGNNGPGIDPESRSWWVRSNIDVKVVSQDEVNTTWNKEKIT
jgi:hypothetical protein